MLLDLLSLSPDRFTSNTFTTGATTSNLLGLTLGREFTLARIQRRRGVPSPSGLPEWSVGEDGFGGIEVDVFTAGAHASIAKTASLCGIGRRNVHELVDLDPAQPCAFNLAVLEERLKDNVVKGRGSIVVTSFGEVNSGGFTPFTAKIRQLCDENSAWLHIDAGESSAWGFLRSPFTGNSISKILNSSFRCLWCPPPGFYAPQPRPRPRRFPNRRRSQMARGPPSVYSSHIKNLLSVLHRLNVPYDCGIFFSRDAFLQLATTGPGLTPAAYLSSGPTTISSSAFPLIDPYRSLPSPLFTNLENSRRFRALPVYSSLCAEPSYQKATSILN